jgi:hypothetical protein
LARAYWPLEDLRVRAKPCLLLTMKAATGHDAPIAEVGQPGLVDGPAVTSELRAAVSRRAVWARYPDLVNDDSAPEALAGLDDDRRLAH